MIVCVSSFCRKKREGNAFCQGRARAREKEGRVTMKNIAFLVVVVVVVAVLVAVLVVEMWSAR
jgi:hypothetical protein